MSEPSPGKPSSEEPPTERLDSWKEIATYFSRDVTTVQRWEKREGMPIHRHLHDRAGSIFAYRSELDEWARGRALRATRENEDKEGQDLQCQQSPEPRIDPQPQKEEASSGPLSSDVLKSRARSLRLRWFALVGIIVTLALVGLGIWLLSPLTALKVTAVTPVTNSRERKFPPIVTDGTRLYFITPEATGWAVAEVSAAGGQAAILSPHLGDIGLADISPNGSELLVWNTEGPGDGPLYLVPLPAGVPRRVGDIVAHDATWSPNGEQILFAHDNDLYVAKPDGSGSRRLVSLPEPALWPRWSPDGKVIRFTEENPKSGSRSLWEMASNGSNLRPLLPKWSDPPSECCGDWLPSTNYFVFISEHANEKSLWALRERAEFLRRGKPEPTQLTTGPEEMLGSVPSRDGKKLYAIGGRSLGELLRYDVTSRQFQPFLSGMSAIFVSFSNDRQWVAYVNYPDGTLWRSRADGTARVQLTFVPMSSAMPAWSPDGKQIAFSAQVPGQPNHIYSISTDGGTPRQMTSGDQDDVYPNWLPGGDALIFGNPFSSDPPAIQRLDLRTGKIAILKNSEGVRAPRLSPDGNFVAALSANNHLMLLDLKAETKSKLTEMEAYHPAWSRDGKYVYFDSAEQGEPAIYRVKIKDQKVESVASLKDVKRPPSQSWANWTGLTPDDSPLALRDISTYEIYALDLQLP